MKLTKRQQQTLEFLKEFIAENGYPPTRKELGEGLGIATTSADSRLRRMVSRGVIELRPTPRGIRVL